MEEKKNQIANYLRTKVSPFITPLMQEMAKKRPDDLLQYTKSYVERLIQIRNNTIESEESENDEEEQKQMERKFQLRRQNKQKKHSRQGISAEVYGEFNQKAAFVPKILPKDQTEKLKIEELIIKSIIFENLSAEDRKIVIDAMTIENFAEGDQIIKEGEQGDILYVVKSGEYSCSKVINGNQTYLKTYKTGEYFGELALMYTAPRAASIKCSIAGTLYGLDRQTFKHIIHESASKKRQNLLQILSKVEILSEIDPYQKEQLCDIVKEETFEAGNYVVREGEEGNKFYMIANGSLVAEKSGQKVFQFKDGDYFGEIALVRNTPRQASIKCISKAHILSVERDAFKRMLGSIEQILKRNQDKYKQYICT